MAEGVASGGILTSTHVPFAQRPTLPPSPRQRLEADYARGIVAAVVGVMVAISAVVIAVGLGSMGCSAWVNRPRAHAFRRN